MGATKRISRMRTTYAPLRSIWLTPPRRLTASLIRAHPYHSEQSLRSSIWRPSHAASTPRGMPGIFAASAGAARVMTGTQLR